MLCDLPKAVQPVCGRAGMQMGTCLAPKHFFSPSPCGSYNVPITGALSVSVIVSYYVALKYSGPLFYRILFIFRMY